LGNGGEPKIVNQGLCSILDEFQRKLKQKFSASHEEIKEAVSLLEEAAFIAYPLREKIAVRAVKDDPDDDNIIACAIAARADYLVTGDSVLLKMRNYGRLKTFELMFE
jgi:putative PIN family toxin of toxin-antitoxin system